MSLIRVTLEASPALVAAIRGRDGVELIERPCPSDTCFMGEDRYDPGVPCLTCGGLEWVES